MGEKTKTEYDAFSEGYDFFAWASCSITSRGYDESMAFLPEDASRALEAGCGSGYLSLRLANHFNHIVAIDISPAMIKFAKKHREELQKANVDFVIADLVNLPFRGEAFDFVVSKTVLHHTPMEVTLRGLSRMVKPSGRMVLCDLITLRPWLDRSPLWQILRILRSIPRYAISLSPRTMWRVVSFQLSPKWIRHLCDPKNKILTPESFREIYSRFLPGCRFERNSKTPWKMVAFWEASKANT
jgi:ubiquinone/menaquinone biosynthesis C-methylase UbiE